MHDLLPDLPILMGAAIALGAASIVMTLLMRSDHAWRGAILTHVIRFALLTGMIIALREAIQMTLAWLEIKTIGDNVLDFVATAVIALVAMCESFLLINHLTRRQIEKGSDATSAKGVARALKAVILLALLLMFGEHFGIGLSGLLAFGGIGGIVIGMASKQALSNVFSGILLFFDRPFSIGDWISSPDRDIEGTVVELGWRITKIQTFDHRPLYVPNSAFSTISVENPGQMTNRRIKTSISLRYEDAGRIAAVVHDIRAMLRANDKIDQTQTQLVNFDNFGGSSLDILVYCFTKTRVWADWLDAQQEVYLAIIDIVHRNGADFAFSSQTLYIEKTGENPSPSATPAASTARQTNPA